MSIRDIGVVGFFLVVFTLALQPIVDNDLFWHLATGRYIWATHAIPHADPFSWTALGRAWIAHEWLTETVLYPLYTYGHSAATMLAFAAVITAAFVVSYGTARCLGAPRWIALPVTALAVAASMHTWGIRPQMLSLLLMAVAARVLTRAAQTGRGSALWALPALMILWVNLHGGFIFGLVLIGVFAVGQTVEQIWPLYVSGRGQRGAPRPAAHARMIPLPSSGEEGMGVQSRVPLRQWWSVLGVSAVACLLNPNGPKGLLYPFSYLGNNASTRYITEWVSPNFHQFQYQLFEALLLALIAGAALAARRPRLTEVLLAILFTHLALDSVRNINLFAIVVAPLIASYLASAWSRLHLPERRPARSKVSSRAAVTTRVGILNLLIAAAMAVGVLVLSMPKLSDRYNAVAQASGFPAGAVAYLRAHHPSGHLLNSYDWGGYLIWTLYPRVRVYVDGRPDMYGDRFIDRYMQTWRADAGWQTTLQRQGVRLVLVEPASGLGRALAGRAGWRIAYHDRLSVLYERTS